MTSKVSITIDGKPVQADEGTTILRAAKSAGVEIPTLCYFKDLNEIGACRVCVVEIEGDDMLSASCNTVVEEGMQIKTNSKRVIAARRVNTDLVLSGHDCYCPSCVRNSNCTLQNLARDLNTLKRPYERKIPKNNWDTTYPLIRDESKCIKCLRCINVCDNIQSLGVWAQKGMGARATVGVAGGKTIDKSNCSLCGQCITHCPVGALRARDDTDDVIDAINDPDKVVVVQIAPAVRSAWGEDIGLSKQEETVGKMVSAIRATGVDYVFDTDFAADLTIMEEGSELVERINNLGDYKWPMFTSCCPAWVRFLKSEYPEMTDNLSTAKSPQQMFGAVAKSYFAKKNEIDPKNIFCVSIMPCVAKKHECVLEVMNSAGAGQDVDVVLTTRELGRLLRSLHVDAEKLEESDFDQPLGESTGAGVIFGVTGGVMEASLRSAYYLITGENADADAFSDIRSLDGWREATYTVNGIKLRLAVTNGLANTRRLMDAVKAGEVEYDFVEVMACPGGCVGGGGQPILDFHEQAPFRAPILYSLDKNAKLRRSHENPQVQKLYEDYMEKPLSHKSHELLHTDHSAWNMPR